MDKKLAKKEQVIEYTASDGQKLALTFETVKKYLAVGHPEFLTEQEVVYFLNICRARKLNPFIKDCYLIKYTKSEPAAIIVSIDFFRKRAKAQRDCRGWKKGVIVSTKDGQIKYTNGLVQKDETLLGGWFEAKPAGWDEPFRLEVNLDGYIKRTREGEITQFWQPEKQPTMIMKVAESQGLRTLWPDEFQQLYTQEEVEAGIGETTIDVTKEPELPPESPEISDLSAKFDAQIPEGTDKEKLNEYLAICSSHFDKTVDEIKAEVAQNPSNFWEQFGEWVKKQKPEQKWKAEFLQKMKALKERLGDEYYKILGGTGYEKAEQVPNKEEAKRVWNEVNRVAIERFNLPA